MAARRLRIAIVSLCDRARPAVSVLNAGVRFRLCEDGAVDRKALAEWVDGYERAWRAAGTSRLDDLFSPQVRYVPSPWATAVEGLDGLRRFWEANRDGPDEAFVMSHEVVAVEGSTAVVRVAVDYHGADTTRWRDLWVLEFGDDGRCTVFEEWPFGPDQPDGH